MSAEEIDDLILIISDIYVPALAPGLHRIEAALKLSNYIARFAVCTIYTRVVSEEG
jgi:hypothetical protein